MRLLITLLASLFLSIPSVAQRPGDCDLGTAQTDLDDSGVRARLLNTGSLFFGVGAEADYIVPQASGNSAIFASAIWIGGLVNGELRAAGSRYTDFEFWPGPLNEGATLPRPFDCSAFDRIWVVSRAEVEVYDATGTATDDLEDWPVVLGAPVLDGDGVAGNYNLEGGDRPLVYGTETAFWVMNDVGNEHDETETPPIGLEVRVTAFSIAHEKKALHWGTFYRYELVNRNTAPFTDAYLGLFLDPDLGNASDDYVGVDTTRSMAFTYNADDEDDVYRSPPPAVGYDFLTGAGSHLFFIGSGPPELTDPGVGEEYYNVMQGLAPNGHPITAFGNGITGQGEVTTWAFPGDPAEEAFWSEVNNDGTGRDNPPGDRRQVISTEAFSIPPGGSHTVDIAILFAVGTGHLNSVTALKAASDLVQSRYDAGTLFAPFPGPTPVALAAPGLRTPDQNAAFLDEPVLFSWTPVDGATHYQLDVAATPDFADPETYFTFVPSRTVDLEVPVNRPVRRFWRVRAFGPVAQSTFSGTRRLTLQTGDATTFADGDAIVEVARPGTEVCPPGASDEGCRFFGGNTVWLSANSTGDYLVTNPFNDLRDLLPFGPVFEGDSFEMRFTEACAEVGACLGVYADAAPGSGRDEIAGVPFELWNVGAEDGPGDDTRMIPLLRGAAALVAWSDAFPSVQPVLVDGDTLLLSVTHQVIGVMPDRPTGYALFEVAAEGFGGPGASYDPEADGDTQIDTYIDRGTGEKRECQSQGYYVDFCYRGANLRFVGVIGDFDGFVLADFAGDGTTPPPGTTIRFLTSDGPLTVGEDDPLPSAPTLGAAYPNPFGTRATVPLEIAEAGRVRLAVYDVLGREVVVLLDRELEAASHHVAFSGAGLASGVYFVVLEADGQRRARKVMLVR